MCKSVPVHSFYILKKKKKIIFYLMDSEWSVSPVVSRAKRCNKGKTKNKYIKKKKKKVFVVLEEEEVTLLIE